MMGNETDKIIEDLFYSFLQRYQKTSEESMRQGVFVFGCFESLCYKLHEIGLTRGGLYIDSPKWLKNEKATINIKNNDDKCFHFGITAALNHEKIKSHPKRISTIKPFIDQYDWKK